MKITLQDGRVIEIDRIIGLSEDGEVFEGYDNRLSTDFDEVTGFDKPEIAPEIRIAIAQVMIQRWGAYLNAAEVGLQMEAARKVMKKRSWVLGKLAKDEAE